MSGVGERQVTGGNGRGPSGRKVLLSLVMEGFWLRDKCRIRAEIATLLILQPYLFISDKKDFLAFGYPDIRLWASLAACCSM